MNIGADLVSDRELKSFIITQNNIGKCDFCQAEKVYIISLDELKDFFQELVDNFVLDEANESIKNVIQRDWSLFSSREVTSNVLNYLLPSLDTDISNSNTGVSYSKDIVDNYSYWETLKKDLKFKNRFLTDLAYLEELGWDGFFNSQFQLTSDKNLFRARLHKRSNEEKFSLGNMGCPPNKEVVTPGRLNASGIPVLYLSDNERTVLFEVRALYLDELSVGTFKLKTDDPIKIVDFTQDLQIFQPGKVSETIKSKLLREKISRDLSKPMRRYDSLLEYIPTQFICEYIKVFTGAEGIRFQSSVDSRGKNIVIFDENLFECTSVKKVKISSVNLSSIDVID